MKKLLLKILGMNVCGWCGGLFKPPPSWAIGKIAYYACDGRYCIKCADEAGKYEAELRQRAHDLNWAKRNPEKLRVLVIQEDVKPHVSQEALAKAYSELAKQKSGLFG